MAQQSIITLLRSRAPQIRHFTQASPFLAAKQTPPPVPAFRAAGKQTARPPPVANKPPPPSWSRAPLLAPKPPPATSTAQNYATGLLGNAESLLLYKAPRSVGLWTSSVILGSSVFLWVGTVSHDVFMQSTMPWYGKVVVLTGCLLGSAMASAIMITPHHLIKSVALVKTAESKAVLRVKGTRYFPFVKPATFDLAPGEMMVDANVNMTLETIKGFYEVPMKYGRGWTEGKIRPAGETQDNAFKRFNRRLVNIAPAAMSQVRKMFTRDSMAYVQIGNGKWKMDLEHCEIMESGSVIMKLVREGAVRTSLLGMATKAIAGKS